MNIPAFTPDKEYIFPYPLRRIYGTVEEEIMARQTKAVLLNAIKISNSQLVSWAYLTAAKQPEKLHLLKLLGIDTEHTYGFESHLDFPGVGCRKACLQLTIAEYLERAPLPSHKNGLYYGGADIFEVYLEAYNRHLTVANNVALPIAEGEYKLTLSKAWRGLPKGQQLRYKMTVDIREQVYATLAGICHTGTLRLEGHPDGFVGNEAATWKDVVPEKFQVDISKYSWKELLVYLRDTGLPICYYYQLAEYLRAAMPERYWTRIETKVNNIAVVVQYSIESNNTLLFESNYPVVWEPKTCKFVVFNPDYKLNKSSLQEWALSHYNMDGNPGKEIGFA